MSLKEFLNQKDVLFKKDYDRAPRYAKFVTHKITPFVVYLCIRLRLTPNAVTTISYLFGVLAAVAFTSISPGMYVLGALMLEIYYIFDSVDGQLARYQNTFSKSGAFFDILGNYIVQPFLLFGIGFGCFRAQGESLYLLLGFAAAMACVWLSQIWEIQARIALDDLVRKGGVIAPQSTSTQSQVGGPSLIKRLFMIAHKTCTFPTLMNVTSICAVVAWLLWSPSVMKYYCVYYGIVLPVIAGSKLTKYILSRDADRYCEAITGDSHKAGK